MFFLFVCNKQLQWLKKKTSGPPDSSYCSSNPGEPFPADFPSNLTSFSLASFNKLLSMRSHPSDLGALLPCNHVLLCMATFVISRWQPNVRRKQFYLMNDHKAGRGYISIMPHQWIMRKQNPIDAWTSCPTIPASSHQLLCTACYCQNVHESYSLPWRLHALNQIGCQPLHYNVVMKNCWLIFKLYRLDNWFMGLGPFMITEINGGRSSGPHFVCWQQ